MWLVILGAAVDLGRVARSEGTILRRAEEAAEETAAVETAADETSGLVRAEGSAFAAGLKDRSHSVCGEKGKPSSVFGDGDVAKFTARYEHKTRKLEAAIARVRGSRSWDGLEALQERVRGFTKCSRIMERDEAPGDWVLRAGCAGRPLARAGVRVEAADV